MNILWRHHPASTRDILERLAGEADWAYTTIKTMLDRLVNKDYLKTRMRANTALYAPLISRQDAQRAAVHGLVETAFDGAFSPLIRFVLEEEKLSDQDQAELLGLLKEQIKKGWQA